MSSPPRFAGVLALDGPSGTGKSTVARLVADRLHARYLDTGAMYRAATVAVLQKAVPLDDPVAITRAVEAAKIQISTDPHRVSVTLGGEPVDAEIRAPETTASVSAVSAVPEVRAIMVQMQRALIGSGGIVVEGRDIGSVVWPTARPKIYLTASPEARARRRAQELGRDTDSVAAEIAHRDDFDSSRAASPLTKAVDAVEVDTTSLAVAEVVERLVQMALAEANS